MNVGFQVITDFSSGPVTIKNGVPITIYGINAIGNTVSDPFIYIQDTLAQSVAHTPMTETTTANVATSVMYPYGLTFPTGCFVEGTDVSQVTVFYKLV